MPGNERASFKATSGPASGVTSENARAINLPNTKGMSKPPTSGQQTNGTSGQKDRKFGRQLSTNNGEAGGATISLQVVPDIKSKPNVSESFPNSYI